MVKYRIEYYSEQNEQWRVEVSTASYTGDPIQVLGIENRACVFTYTNNDDPYLTIIPRSASIGIYNEGQVDVSELQAANDKDFIVEVYQDNLLDFRGYLVPDNIQKTLQSEPYEVSFTAIDGLSMLDDMNYLHNNLPNPTGDGSSRCILNYIRQILFSNNNLGIMLPITWANTVQNETYSGDVFINEVTWSPRGEGFTDFQGNYKSCRYILENLLKAFQCRIFQAGGKWHIRRINDIVTGQFELKECDATLGEPTITTTMVNINKTISGSGDYIFIQENQVTTMIPALRKVKATYKHAKPDNVLPNGGFDNAPFSSIIEWGLRPLNSGATLETDFSLTSRGGNSAKVSFAQNAPGSVQEVYLTLVNSGYFSLPIDSKILFKSFRFGFTFCPLNGFSTSVSTGIIDWSNNPLRIRISTVVNGKTYVLGQYGYWLEMPTGSAFNRYEYTSYAESPTVLVMDSYFNGSPMDGDYISFTQNGNAVSSAYASTLYSNDLIGYLNFAGRFLVDDPNIDVNSYEVIPDGTTGFILRIRRQNTGVNISMSWGLSTNLRDGTIAVKLDGMKLTDVATFNFGSGAEMKFIDPLALLPDQSSIEVRLYVRRGQRIMFDDVYINMEDNNDLYISENPSSTNTKSEDVSLEISSSFSGVAVSNVMTSWSRSDNEYVFNDGKYTGSLTGMTANAMMRFRYKPSVMFNGSIYTKGWTFDEIYNIESFPDTKFLPTQATFNTETSEVDLTACECRDDAVSLSEQHIASNDEVGSTYNLS